MTASNSTEPSFRSSAVRIAMWSGPRTISTAMMRSWGNRPDTFVSDEPLYGYYLRKTGANHPAAAEIIATMETDWTKLAAFLSGPIPEGKTIWFQKQMTHHLLPEIQRDWLTQLRHAFLIRDPREMLPSLLKVTPHANLADTGWPQQVELFEWVAERYGEIPPVVDSRDVLEHPRGVLSRLCERLGVPFHEAMLSWPPGPRKTDGIWAPYWYQAVEQSTGFQPYTPKTEAVPESRRDLLNRCIELYEQLAVHRIRP